MDPEERRKQLERDILSIMEEKLSKGEMSGERAKAIARMMLDKLHPPLTLEQLYILAPTLDDEFAELTKAILPLVKEHEEEVSQLVSKHAEALMKSGKIDEAQKLLAETLNRKTL